MKKIMGLGLALLITVVGLAGCGKSGTASIVKKDVSFSKTAKSSQPRIWFYNTAGGSLKNSIPQAVIVIQNNKAKVYSLVLSNLPDSYLRSTTELANMSDKKLIKYASYYGKKSFASEKKSTISMAEPKTTDIGLSKAERARFKSWLTKFKAIQYQAPTAQAFTFKIKDSKSMTLNIKYDAFHASGDSNKMDGYTSKELIVPDPDSASHEQIFKARPTMKVGSHRFGVFRYGTKGAYGYFSTKLSSNEGKVAY